MEAIRLVAFGVALFGATNGDDLLLLIAWFADPRRPPGQVVAGQYLGQVAILGAAAVAAVATVLIAGPWVRLFGVVPLAIGIVRLGRLALGRSPTVPPAVISGVRGVGGVAALTIASGADNLGVYAPVFATHPSGEIAILVVVTMAMTALWCGVGYRVARHPRTSGAASRWGGVLVSLVLIGVGVSILATG